MAKDRGDILAGYDFLTLLALLMYFVSHFWTQTLSDWKKNLAFQKNLREILY